MGICKHCGKKSIFLTLYGDGFCIQCFDLLAKEKAEKELQQKTEELTYATEYYNSFIAAWKGSIIDDIFNCDIAGLSEAIRFCDSFIELFDEFLNVPRVKDVIRANSSILFETVYYNDALGRVELGEDSSPWLNSLLDEVMSRKSKYQRAMNEVLTKSAAFEKSLSEIAITIPENPGLRLFPKTTDIFPMKESNLTKRTSPSSVSQFFSIDLETTGLSIATAEIIQISAIKFVNFEPVEAFTSYVQPRKGLNPRAQEINHITEEDVSEAPFIEEALPLFDSFVGDKYPIVGHNLCFDYNFLYSTGSRAIVANSLTNGRKFYDTLSLSKREYDFYQKYNLDFLTRRVLGVIRKDSHTALSDALAAGLLFKKIYENRTSS